MKSLPNIEKSGFHHGQYVGYAGDRVWKITRINSACGTWQALARGDNAQIEFARTLAELSSRLEHYDSTRPS